MAISTGTAKSEFIIAPVLLEFLRSVSPKFARFSGVEWDVDSTLGFDGCCDFILGRGPNRHLLQAPFLAIVEAKGDLIRTGLGQCIAAKVAARMCNERAGSPNSPIHGAVSTGVAWKFLRLRGDVVAIDLPE